MSGGDGVADERSPEDEAAALAAELEGLVRLANAGAPGGLDRLRVFLGRHPEAARVAGDLGRIASDAWLRVLSGSPAARELVRRNVATLREDLEGPHPTATERLLAGLAALNYLAAHQAAVSEAESSHSPGRAVTDQKRAESAQRRLTASLKVLAELRCHLRPGLVPTGAVRLHDPDRRRA
jgi:hypothetical protein